MISTHRDKNGDAEFDVTSKIRPIEGMTFALKKNERDQVERASGQKQLAQLKKRALRPRSAIAQFRFAGNRCRCGGQRQLKDDECSIEQESSRRIVRGANRNDIALFVTRRRITFARLVLRLFFGVRWRRGLAASTAGPRRRLRNGIHRRFDMRVVPATSQHQMQGDCNGNGGRDDGTHGDYPFRAYE